MCSLFKNTSIILDTTFAHALIDKPYLVTIASNGLKIISSQSGLQ